MPGCIFTDERTVLEKKGRGGFFLKREAVRATAVSEVLSLSGVYMRGGPSKSKKKNIKPGKRAATGVQCTPVFAAPPGACVGESACRLATVTVTVRHNVQQLHLTTRAALK